MTTRTDSSYVGHRFPAEVIGHAVWLYFRFPLSLRHVDELLAARGVTVSHEAARSATTSRRSSGVGCPGPVRTGSRLNCRGVGSDGRGHGLMAGLLRDIRRGASPETEGGQQVMQVGQRRDGYLRRAELQPRAGGRVEHPARHHDDDARSDFDIDDLAVRPPLAVLPPHAAAMQRVPTVMDDDSMPDVGGMSP